MFLTALCKQQYAYNEDYVVFKPEEKHHRLSRNHNFYTKKKKHYDKPLNGASKSYILFFNYILIKNEVRVFCCFFYFSFISNWVCLAKLEDLAVWNFKQRFFNKFDAKCVTHGFMDGYDYCIYFQNLLRYIQTTERKLIFVI